MNGKKPGEFRRVPGEKSRAMKEDLFRYESAGTFWRATYDSQDRLPVFERMDGVSVWDVDGNEYIDTYGPFAASCLGHAPKELIDEVEDQMRTLMHISDMPNIPRAQLAKELVGIAPGEMKDGRVHFEVGGGPAVDLALEIAEYSTPDPQHDIISFFGGYHGRTIGAVSVAPNAYFRERFPAISNRVIRVPYPYCYRCYFEREYPSCDMYCLKYLRKMFESPEYGLYDPETRTNLVSTLIIEPAQFHGGGVYPPKEYFKGLRQICDDYGIVFIDDEIAIGMGRTGKWFCIEHYGVTPDLIATSKALSGGVWPLSAVIGRREIFDAWADRPDKHMGTWHGNAVGCRAALTVIREIKKKNLLSRCEEMGKHFLEGLKELQTRHRMIGDVQGIGLGLGMELVRDRRTKEPAGSETVKVLTKAVERGVLICRASYYGNRMTFMPPYVIAKSEIDTVLDVLDRCFSEVENA
jgi:4-aminobutyrate aminotransferase-like enzyme